MALTIDLSAGLRPSPPPEKGTPDSRFLFQRKLGQGAEGTVYLAVPSRRVLGSMTEPQVRPRQRHKPRPVAVKVVTGQAFERCRATQGLWSSLVHPNVVFPREVWFDNANGHCFVEMELCDTDLLDMAIYQGALSDARAAVFTGHLASALRHLHSKGIAHQDVKLENVFVRDGIAKLGDLGSIVQVEAVPSQVPPANAVVPASPQGGADDPLVNPSPTRAQSSSARINNNSYRIAGQQSSSPSTSFVGSAMYAPPETVRGSLRGRNISAGSSAPASSADVVPHFQQDPIAGDIWSLGVTLWGAVAGSHPWELACVERSKEFRRFVRKGPALSFPKSFSPGERQDGVS